MLRADPLDVLRGGHSLPGYQHVQYGVFPDVAHSLFVRHHCKVISIALQDLIVNPQSSFSRCTRIVHLSHVNALEEIRWD